MNFTLPRDLSKWDKDFEAKYPSGQASFKRLTIETQKLKALSDPNSSDTTIDLSFLSDLTIADDKFIPSGTIFIRQCMREVFQRFDKCPERRRVILVCSRGVGTSLLCFLSALHLAQRKPVIFLRMTKCECISIFIICGAKHPRESSPRVEIAFTRTFRRDMLSVEGLNGLACFLIAKILRIKVVKDWFIFLDGPQHNEERNTLAYSYNFFCPTGGHPHFKDEQLDTFRCWVLDGWNEEDSIKVLGMYGHSSQKAKQVYALCGGNIEKMIRACSNFEGVREELDTLIGVASGQHSTTKINRTHFVAWDRSQEYLKLPDELITMFKWDLSSDYESHGESDDKSHDQSMDAVQYIDSQYVLTCLAKHIDVGAFERGYDFSMEERISAMQELYYKMLIHTWLDRNVNDIIQKVCWSTGTCLEGLEQFNEENICWIPCISNCANIDAGLVHDGTLHLFQYTVIDEHKFNKETFERYFLHHVAAQIPTILKVVIHVVTPTPPDHWKGLVGDEMFTFASGNAPDITKSISAEYVVNQLVLYGTNVTVACNGLFNSKSGLVWARRTAH